MKDEFGDRMKAFEAIESDRRAVKGQQLLARLDGRAFHTFTRNLMRPFDVRMSDLMSLTTRHLMEQTDALLGYTQSDEISLLWYVPSDGPSQYMFDGRYQKLASILSSIATCIFARSLPDYIPEKKNSLVHFDARVWQVNGQDHVIDYFNWRRHDAIKNSISMQAQTFFSHKNLEGVNSVRKKEMLAEIGEPWETQPDFFKGGVFFKKATVMKSLTEAELSVIPEQYRPIGPVERTEIKPLHFDSSREDLFTF